LERTFDESLGEFDDVLAEGSGGAGTSSEGEDVFDPIGGDDSLFSDESIGGYKGDSVSGTGAGGQGDSGDTQSEGESSGSSGGGQSPTDGNGKSGKSTEKAEPVADIPDDIPLGDGDDIISRQIREAAEQERDPVLREKLWDEYRKYRAQR
jgi:hypothetical protein